MRVKLDECISERKAEIMLYGVTDYEDHNVDVEEFQDSNFSTRFNWELDVVYLKDVKNKTNERCISIDDLFLCFKPIGIMAILIFALAKAVGRNVNEYN